MRVGKSSLVCFVTALTICSCGFRPSQLAKAKTLADDLLNDLGDTSVSLREIFPSKYFSLDDGKRLQYGLALDCDFKNRKGVFVNDFTEYDSQKGNLISEIYEFHLKCGDERLLITYKVESKDSLALFNIMLEPTSHSNFRILHPERQLNQI